MTNLSRASKYLMSWKSRQNLLQDVSNQNSWSHQSWWLSLRYVSVYIKHLNSLLFYTFGSCLVDIP